MAKKGQNAYQNKRGPKLNWDKLPVEVGTEPEVEDKPRFEVGAEARVEDKQSAQDEPQGQEER